MEKLGVYVIKDLGVDKLSLPFFAPSEIVARRQFAGSLRSLPPSTRPDFSLVKVAEYDEESLKFDNLPCLSEVCSGDDESIKAIIAVDAHFYQHTSIDEMPLVSGGMKNAD